MENSQLAMVAGLFVPDIWFLGSSFQNVPELICWRRRNSNGQISGFQGEPNYLTILSSWMKRLVTVTDHVGHHSCHKYVSIYFNIMHLLQKHQFQISTSTAKQVTVAGSARVGQQSLGPRTSAMSAKPPQLTTQLSTTTQQPNLFWMNQNTYSPW